MSAELPIYAVRPGDVSTLPASSAAMLQGMDFTAKAGSLVFLQDTDGLAGAVFGLGSDRSPHLFGDLPYRLPAGRPWRLVPGDYDPAGACLGFALGAYRYTALKPAARAPAIWKYRRAASGAWRRPPVPRWCAT